MQKLVTTRNSKEHLCSPSITRHTSNGQGFQAQDGLASTCRRMQHCSVSSGDSKPASTTPRLGYSRIAARRDAFAGALLWVPVEQLASQCTMTLEMEPPQPRTHTAHCTTTLQLSSGDSPSPPSFLAVHPDALEEVSTPWRMQLYSRDIPTGRAQERDTASVFARDYLYQSSVFLGNYSHTSRRTRQPYFQCRAFEVYISTST